MLVLPACLTMGLWARPTFASGPTTSRGSISFADEKAREAFDEYESFLAKRAARCGQEIATLQQLERSEIEYVVVVANISSPGNEGSLTTDGQRVIITLQVLMNIRGMVSSLNSRFAHEFEHARQFDNGEVAFAQDPKTGEWGPALASYDIGDEVKAWSAQIDASVSTDYWTSHDGFQR